ncbi:MAG: hypothetical protein WA996_18705 [Candidatus Promineifilaceae bacterium]
MSETTLTITAAMISLRRLQAVWATRRRLASTMARHMMVMKPWIRPAHTGYMTWPAMCGSGRVTFTRISIIAICEAVLKIIVPITYRFGRETALDQSITVQISASVVSVMQPPQDE